VAGRAAGIQRCSLACELCALERRKNELSDRRREVLELPGAFTFCRLDSGRGPNSANSVPGWAERMIGHMRSCDSVACGARRFTGGGIGGIPCGSMRSGSSSASGADANLSSRPSASRLDRAPWPVVEGTARFEQRKHVFCTVGRPDGKLPMPI
jgi:hypothetical protein